MKTFSVYTELFFYGLCLVFYMLVDLAINRFHGPPYGLASLIPGLQICLFAFVWTMLHPESGEYLKLKGCYANKKALSLAALLAIVLLIFLMRQFLHQSSTHYNSRLIVIVLFAPIFEEIYFRGLLLRHLVVNLNALAGILLTSFIFAFIHFPQGIFPQMMIFSILTSYATVKLRSVNLAIIMHIVLNTCSEFKAASPLHVIIPFVIAAIISLIWIGMKKPAYDKL